MAVNYNHRVLNFLHFCQHCDFTLPVFTLFTHLIYFKNKTKELKGNKSMQLRFPFCRFDLFYSETSFYKVFIRPFWKCLYVLITEIWNSVHSSQPTMARSSNTIFILATGSTSFTGPYWWSEQENNTGCPDSHTMVSCSINAASFCFPHTWSRWSFDSILTSMHTSEASSTKKKWKSHAHCRQLGTSEYLFGCLGSMSQSVVSKQHATSSQHWHYHKPGFGPCFKANKLILPILKEILQMDVLNISELKRQRSNMLQNLLLPSKKKKNRKWMFFKV